MKIGTACLTVAPGNNYLDSNPISSRAYWDVCKTSVDPTNPTDVAAYKL